MNKETKDRAEHLHNEIAGHLTLQEMDMAQVWGQTKTLEEVIGEVLDELPSRPTIKPLR